MFSTDVSKCLAKLHVTHKGVYPRDLLPRSVHTPSAIVVNTDPHTRPGTHWTAIYINENREADYFDSYGRPPNITCKDFIQRNSRVARFSTLTLQSLTSSLCGQYCVLFLYFRSRGFSMDQFLNMLTNSTAINDRLISLLFAEYFGDVYSNEVTNKFQTCRCMRRTVTCLSTSYL